MHVQTRQTPLLSTHALQGRTLLVVKLSAHHVQLESSAPTMSKFLLAAHSPVTIIIIILLALLCEHVFYCNFNNQCFYLLMPCGCGIITDMFVWPE